MIETGWVYVITNESMPGLVKVGVTKNRPEQRAKELDETGSPTPYKIETAFLFSEAAERIEKRAHALLADVRVRENREWFKCLAGLAAEKVLDAADTLNSVVLKNEPALLSQRDLLLREERRKIEKQQREEEEARQARKREEEKVAESLRLMNEQAAKNREQEQQKLIEKKRAATWDLYQIGLKQFNPLAKQARSGDFKAQILIEYYNRIKPKSYGYYWSINEYDNKPTGSGGVRCFLNVLKTDPVKIFHYFNSVKINPKSTDTNATRVSLGHCYALGFGVKANPKMAFDLFKKGVKWRLNSDLGRLRAANALAQCYHLGFGVAKNPLKAALMKSKVKSLKREVKRQYPRWNSET
ncbi:GIY-YIG nuclease family protein [Akkermansiaceae bacterium]|nr:GIY-YIG nuclease family protein [Akkermansiaceae bacterium]